MDAIPARAKERAAKQGGKVAMVYLESPANPTNALVDVQAMRAAVDAAFAQDARPPIAIANTFLGPRWSAPLHHGDDVEHGRESCRERRCQDVEFTGLGGVITKKSKKPMNH